MAQRLWVGTRKGLFDFARRDGAWTLAKVHFLGEPVTAVAHDPRDDSVVAALNLGHFGVKVHRSDDAGATWREVATPTYPPKPDDPHDEHPWTLTQIWTLVVGAHPGALWAGTLPGGLFRSDDGGASWRLDRALWDRPERREWMGGGYDVPGLHSISLDPRDPRRAHIAVSTGGAWTTHDDGATWQLHGPGLRAGYMPPERAFDPRVQDVHALARCHDAPDVLWIQHHNGIFRSTDDGAHWVEVTTAPVSNFGFAVAAHPHDPRTAWFVPAIADQCRVPVGGRMVVQRTRDGGQTFEVLGNGLPSAGCYDLVYRHGLAVDETGDGLAMGSTTGNLWVSDDGGDAWTTLSTHLPPIACVALA